MVEADQPSNPNGKTMVARFRAERLAKTEANRITRQEGRQSLRKERLTRLGRPMPAEAAPPRPAMEQPLPTDPPPASFFACMVEQDRRDRQVAADDPENREHAEDHFPAQDIPPSHGPAGATEIVPECQDTTGLHEPALTGAPPPHASGETDDSGSASNPSDATPENRPVPASPLPEAAPATLTSLGFGPGMTTRMHHLGIFTITDLAGAEPTSLKTMLGDVGDLVNVDYWIAQARALLRKAA